MTLVTEAKLVCDLDEAEPVFGEQLPNLATEEITDALLGRKRFHQVALAGKDAICTVDDIDLTVEVLADDPRPKKTA